MVVSRAPCRFSSTYVEENGSALWEAVCVLLVLVITVKERMGRLSFLVRRREAEVALMADFRARLRGVMGSSRLMVFLAVADWIV